MRRIFVDETMVNVGGIPAWIWIAFEPAGMYYYWSPPSSITMNGATMNFVSGPSSIWVNQDKTNTAVDYYQEPARWKNLNLQVVSGGGGTYNAQTTGYLIDQATGGGIGGQTIQIQYTEYFYDGTGGSGPTDYPTTNSQGYFSNLQGMGPFLTTVQAYISWYNPPSITHRPVLSTPALWSSRYQATGRDHGMPGVAVTGVPFWK